MSGIFNIFVNYIENKTERVDRSLMFKFSSHAGYTFVVFVSMTGFSQMTAISEPMQRNIDHRPHEEQIVKVIHITEMPDITASHYLRGKLEAALYMNIEGLNQLAQDIHNLLMTTKEFGGIDPAYSQFIREMWRVEAW